MAETVELRVGGSRYQGWTSVEVTRSLEAVAGTFELSVTERWPGNQKRYAIHPGDRCSLRAGGDVVIDGYVDVVEVNHGADQHTVRISGRDRAGDLVDCSAIVPGGEFKGRDLAAIARALCEPFGIPVTAEADVGKPFDRFAIDQGETAFEAIERGCRQRAVLPVADGRGGLKLTNAGQAGRSGTTLRLGDNILSARGTYSHRDRFSTYTVKGQDTGSDFAFGELASEPSAEVRDGAIARHRPLLLTAEGPGSAGSMQERAKWERAVRRGRSRRAEIRVQGWRQDSGALWAPNALVPVVDDWLAIDRTLLVAEVRYSLDQSGTVARLSLASAEAFQLRPESEDDTQDQEFGW